MFRLTLIKPFYILNEFIIEVDFLKLKQDN